MNQINVYDIPTRVLHWLFAGLFLTAFVIAKTVDDESAVFSVHMLAGLTLGLVVVLRLIWGFVGTKHARFSSFALNPGDLVLYIKGVVNGDRRLWAGHNPASSWAAVLMFALVAGLMVSGIGMANGNEETWEEVHEVCGNALLLVAILHIAGVVLHTIRHRDPIALSMINGTKSGVSEAERIADNRAGVGVIFMGVLVAFGIYLNQNFDSNTRALNLFGTTLQLGETEEDEHGKAQGDAGASERDEDEDEEKDDD